MSTASSHSSWRPLPLPSTASRPALLVSAHFTSTSYSVYISDTVRLWVEQLDRRAIIMRALREDTAIDPSETPENMASFLKSMQSALDASSSTHDRTALAIWPGDDGKTGPNGLTLVVTCELPKGISDVPLTWHMYLRMTPRATVATELLYPVLSSHLAQAARIRALREVAQQKDAVIARLLDKLESSGITLDNVFPALTTKRRVTRELAAERVKGLAPFEDDSLSTAIPVTLPDSDKAVEALLDETFQNGLAYQNNLTADGLNIAREWWHGITKVPPAKKTTASPSELVSSGTLDSNSSHEPIVEHDAELDDPFESSPQRGQYIPQDRGRVSAKPAAEDTDTASEEDEYHQSIQRTRRKSPSPPPKRKLGRIGGALARDPSVSPQRGPIPTETRAKENLGRDSDATASEDESPKKDPTPARRIGKITGARQENSSTPPPRTRVSDLPPKPEPEQQTSPHPEPEVPRRRIGRIGISSRGESHVTPETEDTKTESISKRAVSESTEGGSSAKADVPKTVVKPHAPPVKKRRRF